MSLSECLVLFSRIERSPPIGFELSFTINFRSVNVYPMVSMCVGNNFVYNVV